MRDFELYGTVAAAVSICDSMNYILEYDDLVKVFKLVNNYLDPKGLFIFDLNTYYNVGKMLSEAGKHYGDGIIKEYSKRLTNDLGKGYSKRNLWLMLRFYEFKEKMAGRK